MIARMNRDSFGRLYTAISCNRNGGIRLRVSDTKSRLETSKDRHFRLPEVQGKLQLLLGIIYYARRSRIFWYEFTYLNSSRITMLIKLAKQLLPTWTIKDKPYMWNFPLYSSSSDHQTNIIQCRSNGNISSVETLCPNIYNNSIAPTEQDTEQDTRKSVHKFFSKLFGPNDKANDTKERLIY